MQSGCEMPKLHCSFKGCRWTCNGPFTPRMERESLLCVHLAEKRRKVEMALVPEEAWPVPDDNYRAQGISAIILLQTFCRTNVFVPK